MDGTENEGRHLNVDEWHALMDSPESVIVDVRNHYERCQTYRSHCINRGICSSGECSEIGRFERALTPNVGTYRESFTVIRDMLKGKEVRPVSSSKPFFLVIQPWSQHKPILMYCTGGIRCEKMSRYLSNNGIL